MAKQYNFKGGRTAAVPMRFTPEEKAALQTAAASAGMSMSDFVMTIFRLHTREIEVCPQCLANGYVLYDMLDDNGHYQVEEICDFCDGAKYLTHEQVNKKLGIETVSLDDIPF